ncbi:MAG: anion permease [Desulfovibrionaceae bacterium]|nr:anion permease [Desulfovibrionaceae bacterium]
MKITSIVSWIVTVLVGVVVYYTAPLDVSPKFPIYLSLTCMAVSAWATNILPATIIAAILTFAYILTGTASPKVVFSPWGTVMPWLTFAAVNIGLAMERTNLAKRMALHCLRLTGGTFHGLMIGYALAGIALVLILPSVMGRLVICCAMAVGMIEALNIDAKSRMSSAIIMMAFFAASGTISMFLHSSDSFIWAFGILFKDSSVVVDWWEYLREGTLIAVIYYVLSMLLVYVVKGREKIEFGSEFSTFIKESFDKLGPMSVKEKKLLVISIAVILAFMTQTLTGLNPAFIFCGLTMLCYFPGIDILKEEDVRKLNITIMVFVTGCMSIGSVGDVVGANTWVVKELMPMLQSLGYEGATIAAYVFGVLVNFLLTPLGAMAAFTPSFAELGAAMQVNPMPAFLAFHWGLDQFVFPYEAVYFLYIFVTGKVLLRHIAGALLIRMALCGLLLAVVGIPYWKLIGLM